jgi:hypothetical protein
MRNVKQGWQNGSESQWFIALIFLEILAGVLEEGNERLLKRQPPEEPNSRKRSLCDPQPFGCSFARRKYGVPEKGSIESNVRTGTHWDSVMKSDLLEDLEV